MLVYTMSADVTLLLSKAGSEGFINKSKNEEGVLLRKLEEGLLFRLFF